MPCRKRKREQCNLIRTSPAKLFQSFAVFLFTFSLQFAPSIPFLLKKISKNESKFVKKFYLTQKQTSLCMLLISMTLQRHLLLGRLTCVSAKLSANLILARPVALLQYFRYLACALNCDACEICFEF